MTTLLFDLLVFSLIYLQYHRENNWINMISVLTAPYALFATLNNFFFVKLGFFKITNQTLLMLGVSFTLFFIGGFAFNIRVKPQISEKNNIEILNNYDLTNMVLLLYLIGIIGFIKLGIVIVSGAFSANGIHSVEGVLGSGAVGHLLLLSYSITPIVFLAWIEKRKMYLLIPVLLIAAITFFSLIKNNIIGFIMGIFLFITYYKKSLMKKALIICVTLIATVFVGNYLFTFLVSKTEAAPTFYVNHLIVYCSGSMINDGKIFTEGIRIETDLGYKIMTALMGFPNMFISKLFGQFVFPFESLNEMNVGSSYGQTSNVLDSFGYFYPSKGTIIDILMYGLFVIIIGMIFSIVYYKSSYEKRGFNVFICNFMTYFVAFSFFGTFYILSAPWEILIYSSVIPYVFYKPKRRISILAKRWRRDLSL